MSSLSRRDFLLLSALAAAGAAAGACGDARRPGVERRAAALVAQQPSTQPPTTPAVGALASAKVAAIRGNDLYAMTHEALEALGGIGRVVNQGDSVFIKPNMVTLPWAGDGRNPFRLGECTKPEIAIAVAEECLRAGAREVIVGDGSQMPRFDWRDATTLDGATNLAQEVGRLSSDYEGAARVACLEVDSPGWVEVPTGISLGRVAISTLVTQADRVISIPVLKTHRWAHLTLSLKNFIGITPLLRYGWENAPNYDRADLHRRDYTPEAMARLYLDLAWAVKPDLAIIDASIGLEGDGPTCGDALGTPVDMSSRLGSWLLLASTDPVAADATAARVINHDDVYAEGILSVAQMEGLGLSSADAIEIDGAGLDELRVEWRPAKLAIDRGERHPSVAPLRV
jgi:uncharacterized protein (DUF362 family)